MSPDTIASRLAAGIRRVAEHAHSEEDLRIGVEELLKPALQELGIDVAPRYEKSYAPHGSILRGRSDAVYGHAVIEYEPVGALARPAGVSRAAEQLDRYLQAEAGDGGAAALRRAIGIGLDGERIFFLRYRREPVGQFDTLGPYPVSEESVQTLLLYLRALRRRPLTPEALAEEFGPRGQVARKLVATLYGALRQADRPKVQTFFDEWDRLFGIVYGQELTKAEKDAQELARTYGLARSAKLKPLLFAVHTYYALLMKLLALELASLQGGSFMVSFVADLPGLSGREIRDRLEDLENGGLFARLGIRNFLEGDFFGWYLAIWNRDLEESIRELARALSDFEPATGTLEPAATRDLLKKLYQYLVPPELRHDLGEYYTPDWLAELTLDEAGYRGDPAKRILDPACGSGTFLVLAIRRAREYADEHLLEPRETVQQILANVVGFDLNPLAVIAARTNYLLALGSLVRYQSPLEIPVYLCDSVLTPAEQKGAQTTFLSDYTIPSTVGPFHVPRAIVAQGELPHLTALLEECVREGYAPAEFLARARRQLTGLDGLAESSLEALFRKIGDLERKGRNGLWARILKNAFAPVFAGRFDYVVGNPPWVRWGYLADEYRQATLKLWVDYGLFSLKGMAARLGGGEKDLSMLFLYACADSYLKSGGVLGFVITQEVLKGKGAGEGFRRFQLGEGGEPLRALKAHDLVSVAPFEGAANKTAVLVLEKGTPTTYPVPYILWRRRRGVGALDPGVSLEEAKELTEREDLLAQPIGVSAQGAWQTTAPGQQSSLARLRGSPAYTARRGASTEPYGVFLLKLLHIRPDGLLVVENLPELGKREIPKVQAVVEPDLVFPAIRGADIQRWIASPEIYVLIAQDPETREGYSDRRMKVDWPKTYKYLKGFENVLRDRAAFKKYYEPTDPFYSQFNISRESFSHYRVTWKRMAGDLVATVLSTWRTPFGKRPPIGTDTTSFIPVESLEEAHYLCALLNSTPARAYIRSFSSAGRGFGAPSIISHIALPTFDRSNRTHESLSRLSQEAHRLTARGKNGEAKLHEAEAAIDQHAAALWGITSEENAAIRQALAERGPRAS